MNTHTKHLIWLVPLLLLVTGLGARMLDAETLWLDEYWSVYNAGGAQFGPLSPAEVWNRIATEDPWQAPGYYMLLSAWGALTGWTAFAGRALSLLLGVLAVALTYRLGAALFTPLAGLGAALTLGTSVFFTIYLHELRGYTLYALLTAGCVWSYWRIVQRKGGLLTQVGFVLSLLGLLYTHYFAALVAAAVGLYHLLFVPRDRHWWRPVILMGIAGLLFLPWFGVTLEITNLTRDERRSFAMNPRQAVESILHLFSNGSIALMALLGLVGLRLRSRANLLIWFVMLVVLALALLVNAWIGILTSTRYVMSLWPLLAVIVGVGIDRLARYGVRPVIPLGIWLLAGLWNTFDPAAFGSLYQPYVYLPWDNLAAALAPRAQERDAVIFLLPLEADTPMHKLVAGYYLYDLPGRYDMMESPLRWGDVGYDQRARAAIGDAQRLWVAYDPEQEPDYRMRFDQVLIESHVICATPVDTADLHLSLYAPLPDDRAASMRFGDQISMTLLAPLPDRADQPLLTLLLGWRLADDAPRGVYSTALHVENAAGELVTQADYALPSEPFSCAASDIALDGLPPGEYTLLAAVYDWRSGERLPGTTAASAVPADRLPLGRFTIP